MRIGFERHPIRNMTCNRIWPALLGLVVGLAGGFVVWGHRGNGAGSAGTAVLREFSFSDVSAKAGNAEWQVIEDKTYDPFLPLSRSKQVARRIVAQATVPDSEQAGIMNRLQQASEAALESRGAVIKGQSDASQSTLNLEGNDKTLRQLDLPRRYYAVNDVHGVADVWCIGESGKLTCIVSLTEGP